MARRRPSKGKLVTFDTIKRTGSKRFAQRTVFDRKAQGFATSNLRASIRRDAKKRAASTIRTRQPLRKQVSVRLGVGISSSVRKPRRTPQRKLPVIKRVRQSRPSKQVSFRLASSVQTRPALKPLPPFRRKIKPPTFGRARAGARGRRPIRVKPKGRLVSVRKRPFRSEKILRVASRGLGVRRVPTRTRQARTQLAQFVPFQQQRPRPTRGQKRLRSTPSKQRAVRESFGAFAGAIQETPQFRIGRAIAEELPPVRVVRKLSKVKLKADKPFPFAKFGSDFDVLNLFQ